MKMAAAEALFETGGPGGASRVFAIGDVSANRERRTSTSRSRTLLSLLATDYAGTARSRASTTLNAQYDAGVRARQVRADRRGDLLVVPRSWSASGRCCSCSALVGLWLTAASGRLAHAPAVPAGPRSPAACCPSSPTRRAGSSPRWAASRGSCQGCSRPRTPTRPTVSVGQVVTHARRLHAALRRARRDRAAGCSCARPSTCGRPTTGRRPRRTPSAPSSPSPTRSSRWTITTALQTLWFVLIRVLWIGYFVLEGFDFGVGMLLRVLGRDEQRPRAASSTHRAGLGRQRGLAARRRRRDVRRLPGLVRDAVLRLLPRAVPDPRRR